MMKRVLSVLLTLSIIVALCTAMTGCDVISELKDRIPVGQDEADVPDENDHDDDSEEKEAPDSTIALIVGKQELTAVELNYFYIDAVTQFYNAYGAYASMFGLDVTKPLNEQINDISTSTSWADYFLTTAQENAKAVCAMVDEAESNNFTMSPEEIAYIDARIEYLSVYAGYYGYSDVDDYLVAVYGSGASVKTIRGYYEKYYLAQAYQQHITDSLNYTKADLAAADAENPAYYTSYSYNSYYISNNNPDAEETARQLTTETITSVETLDAAVAALDINADNGHVISTPYENQRFPDINIAIQNWISDMNRQPGDLDYIPHITVSDDGSETVNGYYVVFYVGCETNDSPLANVRHILAKFEGSTVDENGWPIYSDEEKLAAKAIAEDLLAQWQAGDATEESFAAMANQYSDDGDGTTGGLYSDIYPGQMVTAFEDWCFEEGRMPGDTGIIETEYGYHVMYYVGDSEMTYRDYLITQELTTRDIASWYDNLMESTTLTLKDTTFVPMDMVIAES